MIYELRTYHCKAGRLDDLLARFRGPTLEIWARLQIRTMGFWTTKLETGEDLLIYLVAWESMEDRDEKMTKFMADEDWIAAKVASEKAGPLVDAIETRMLIPTDFSGLR